LGDTFEVVPEKMHDEMRTDALSLEITAVDTLLSTNTETEMEDAGVTPSNKIAVCPELAVTNK
jgi:hypothetical protein